MVVEAVKNEVSISVDGKQLNGYIDPGEHYASGGIALTCINDSVIEFEKIEYERLRRHETTSIQQVESLHTVSPFNGRDFDGWRGLFRNEQKEPAEIFRIEQGEFVWAGQSGRIYTDAMFHDVSFEFDYLVASDGRRSQGFGRLHFSVAGNYQVEKVPFRISELGLALMDGPFGNTGDVVVNRHGAGDPSILTVSRSAQPSAPFDKWNHVEIRCAGRELTFKVNHEVVNRLVASQDVKCHVGLNSIDTDIRFRNIRLIPLADAKVKEKSTSRPDRPFPKVHPRISTTH